MFTLPSTIPQECSSHKESIGPYFVKIKHLYLRGDLVYIHSM